MIGSLQRMPWTCPACGTQVQHSATLVCKLHMTFDPVLKKMQPAADGHDNDDTQGHAV
jgi:hypothetical protein